jgi:DNA-binding transcriptional LysR family regulator
MDNRVGEMQVFVRVIATGSFSAAARELGMTPSTVSKLVARIERRLGVRLIQRSTRRLSATAEGLLYHERAQQLLAELDDIDQALARGAGCAGGIVRVASPVAFANLALVPLLPVFLDSYPAVVVDLSVSDELGDLYLDRTDVAFRVGRLSDSALHARAVATIRRRIVASPGYLQRHGVPQTAADLVAHSCLDFNYRRVVPQWPEQAAGPLLANNGETLRQLALAGVGLARLGDYHVREDLAAGRLVEVLAGSDIADQEQINALYRGGVCMALRVRAFLDFMLPRLQEYLQVRPAVDQSN